LGYLHIAFFFPKHGYSGILYGIGEHCLVNHAREDTVIEISKIFAIEFSTCTAMYVKGTIFSLVTEGDQISLHSYSLNHIVQQTSNQLVALAAQVVRKVMLYPHDKNFLLIDYTRTHIPVSPSEVLVPFYPQVGDMVSVSGEAIKFGWPKYTQLTEKLSLAKYSTMLQMTSLIMIHTEEKVID